uniref:Uncharacterized protein n=1 Tax=viral metagenome TaxID=1070528 RepID=A0A6C0CBU5_9ZZZZ
MVAASAKLDTTILRINENNEIFAYLLLASNKYISPKLIVGVNMNIMLIMNEIKANCLLPMLKMATNGETICAPNKKNNVNSIIK